MANLLGEQAFNLLKKYHIPIVSYKFINNTEGLLLPCVLKVPSILHKTEQGAVKIVYTEKDLVKAYRKLKGRVMYQPFIEGQEIIIGIKNDETFGKVIMFGAGGIYTKVLKDVSFRVCPITKKDAQDMISETKVLRNTRKKFNIKLLTNTLLKVNKLAMKENIKELDINPFILNDKAGCAVDVRVIK